MNIRRFLLALASVLALGAAPAFERFVPGNLVILRVGDGRAEPADSVAAPVFLDEVDPASGSVVGSTPIPTAPAAGQWPLTLSASATSEGQLTLSRDGRYLVLVGYAVPPGQTQVSGGNIPRVIGRVDLHHRVDTSTLLSDGFAGNNIRGAATVDGTTFFVAGAGSKAGTRAVTLGSKGTSEQICMYPGNTRAIDIVDGQLYVTSAHGGYSGLNAIGHGVSTAPDQESVPVAPISEGMKPAPTGFAFVGDALYIAERTSGLIKFEHAGTSKTARNAYKPVSQLELPGLTQLTGRIEAGKAVLYGTDGDQLYRIIDDGSKLTPTPLLAAGPRRAFRGLAFAPTTPPPIPLAWVIAAGAGGATLLLATGAATVWYVRRRTRRTGGNFSTSDESERSLPLGLAAE
jgi:hypothetical protein